MLYCSPTCKGGGVLPCNNKSRTKGHLADPDRVNDYILWPLNPVNWCLLNRCPSHIRPATSGPVPMGDAPGTYMTLPSAGLLVLTP